MVAEPVPVLVMQASQRHILFVVSIFLKGVFAVAELVAGIAIYASPPEFINNWVHGMLRTRLFADPNDPFAQFVLHQAHEVAVTRHTFVSLYLMSHGLVKIFIVAALFSRRLWAFPLGMSALALFIVYQMHRWYYTHSPWLVMISIFDAFIIWLTWREYQALKRHEI